MAFIHLANEWFGLKSNLIQGCVEIATRLWRLQNELNVFVGKRVSTKMKTIMRLMMRFEHKVKQSFGNMNLKESN